MATQWTIRKSGNNANGGTSNAIRSNGTDGVTNAGNSTLTSITGTWAAGDIGHGVVINGTHRLITAVASATSLTYSGATLGTHTAFTWVIGGPLLTITGSQALVASGDSVAIGAGTYREVLAFSTNTVTYTGDVDGALTGDAGDVIVTAYTTNDKTAPSSSVLLAIGTHTGLSFTNIDFIGGNANLLTGGSGCATITFTACSLRSNTSGTMMNLTLAVDVNSAILFDRCALIGLAYNQTLANLNLGNSATADYDAGVTFRNCLLVSATLGTGIATLSLSSSTKPGGGVKALGCTFIGCANAFTTISGVFDTSSKFPAKAIGCYFIGCQTAVAGRSGRATVIEDYNVIDASTARSNVAAGPNSQAGQSYAPLIEFWEALITGRSNRPPLTPMIGSPLLGFWTPTQISVGIPATAADDATVGTIAWTTPANATYAEGTSTTAALTAGTTITSHYLKVTNFGFALPTTATVTGIRVEYLASHATSAAIVNSVKLVKGGTIGGTDNSGLGVNTTTAMVLYSIGAANDLWGQAWLYSDINASTFGVALSFKNSSAGSACTVSVDYVRMIVNYTDSAGLSSEQSVDFTNNPRPAGGSPTIAAGALERGNTAVPNSSVTDSGNPSYQIAGPGYHDFPIVVDAVLTTISVDAQYDASYTGTLPQFQVLANGQCGVTLQTVTMTAVGSGVWATLTLTFTPTRAGQVSVRIKSSSTAAAGNAYFSSFS